MLLPGLAVRSTCYVKGPGTRRTLPHDAPLRMPPPGPYIPQTMHTKTNQAASVFFNTMPSTRVEKAGGGQRCYCDPYQQDPRTHQPGINFSPPQHRTARHRTSHPALGNRTAPDTEPLDTEDTT